MSSEPATSSSAAPPPQEKPNPFAALGSSGAQFGSAGGFSFGVPGAVAPKPEAEEEGGDGEDEAAPEEECQVCACMNVLVDSCCSIERHSSREGKIDPACSGKTCRTGTIMRALMRANTCPCMQAEFKPVVQLDEVETSTGEEDEDALLEL
eukprot:1156487-Pelagomonas_calceolata.AAC.2